MLLYRCLLGGGGLLRRLVDLQPDFSLARHRSSTSIFEGKLVRNHDTVDDDDNRVRILHINASHSPSSLVSVAANELFANLGFPHKVVERNLWATKDGDGAEEDGLLDYNISHVAAKMRLLKGKGSKEDEITFKPVLKMAEELNWSRILVVSSPMWNFSFPYVLKQYIDIAVQPGINFSERPERPVTGQKTLVIISSSGGSYGEVNPRDFLNSYLEHIFGMVGYETAFKIKIQGAAQKPRDVLIKFAQVCALDVASELNDTYRQNR